MFRELFNQIVIRMLLDMTVRKNPELIKWAVDAHQSGEIPPNTYVIDLDSVEENTRKIKQEADKYGIENYFMTKQIGRNPIISEAIVKNGIKKAVAVDFYEACILDSFGIQVGHVGHLVQVPRNFTEKVLKDIRPEVVTVYSYEKAVTISKVAERLGIKQDIMIRPYSSKDFFWPGQEGGIRVEDVERIAKAIQRLEALNLIGVTSYPCVELNEEKTSLVANSNFDSLIKASNILKKLGIEVRQINAPGSTCCAAMKVIHDHRGTHGEPGHGLTGDTYVHAYTEQPEKPCTIYVSEVSHFVAENTQAHRTNSPYQAKTAEAFGGGLYWRSNVAQALVGTSPDNIFENRYRVDPEKASAIGKAIDYYIPVELDRKKAKEGDTVIFAFRYQIFTSRAFVAVVEGIRKKRPNLLGIFDRGYGEMRYKW